MNWKTLRSEPCHTAHELRQASIPRRPGVYAWLRQGTPVYVDAARNLQRRLIEIDSQGWDGRGRSPSQFRQRLAAYLSQQPAGLPDDTDERRARLDDWISACCARWIETDSFKAARSHVHELLMEERPVLSRWQPRPGEDRWLVEYLRLLGGVETVGRVHVEVPIGGAARHGQGAKTRYVDAVRFPGTRPDAVLDYDENAFHEGVRRGSPVEVIEIKAKLNRPVIGQLVVARELAPADWGLAPDVDLRLVALVTESDPALEPVCTRLGIRVIVVPRNPASSTEAGDPAQ